MSGIVHTSRLARLLELRDRLDGEIATERAAEKHRKDRAAEQRRAADLQRRQQRRDSVPAAVVRAWAVQYGHPFPERGRVPDSLIDLYLDAHPEAARRTR